MSVTVNFPVQITKLLWAKNSFLFLFLLISPSYIFADSDILVANFESKLEREALEFHSHGEKTEIFGSETFLSVTKLTFTVPEVDWEEEERDFLLEAIVLQKQVRSDFRKEMAGFEPTQSIKPLTNSDHDFYSFVSKTILFFNSNQPNPPPIRLTNVIHFFRSLHDRAKGFRPICLSISIPDRLLQFLAIKLNSPPPKSTKQVHI